MNINSTELGLEKKNISLNIIKGSKNIKDTHHSEGFLCCM